MTGVPERVNVLYDISPRTLGGTERFLSRFLGCLDRDRFAPTVVSGCDGPPLQLLRAQDVPTVVIGDFESDAGVQRLAALMRARNIRLAQSNYYSFTVALAARAAGVRHIWRPGGHVAWGSGLRSAHDARVAVEMMQLLSTAILCNSRYVAAQFGRRPLPSVVVIHNGITMMSRRRRRRPGPFRIGMVAHLTPQKRHHHFLHAAERVADAREDVQFRIHGRPLPDPVSRTYAAEVRRAAARLIRSGRLTLAAFAPGEDPVADDLDVVVLPSIGESFSNALLEAMASGLPVIAARSGGNPELVEDRKTGLLVAPEEPRALADAMLTLVDCPALAQAMGSAARARVRRHFSLESCVARYEEVYRRVLATDGASPARRAHTELS